MGLSFSFHGSIIVASGIRLARTHVSLARREDDDLVKTLQWPANSAEKVPNNKAPTRKHPQAI